MSHWDPVGVQPVTPPPPTRSWVGGAIGAVLLTILLVVGLILGLTRPERSDAPRNEAAKGRPTPTLSGSRASAVTIGKPDDSLDKLTYAGTSVTLQIDSPRDWYRQQNRFNNAGEDVASAFLQRHRSPDGYAFGSSVWVGATPAGLTDLHEAADRAVLWNAQHAYDDQGQANVATSRPVSVDGHAGWEITGTVSYDIPGVPWHSDTFYTLAIKFETGEVLQVGYAVITDEAGDRAAGTASMQSLVIRQN